MEKYQIKIVVIVLIIGLIYLGVFYYFFGEKKETKNNNVIKSSTSSSTVENEDRELIMLFNPHIKIKYDGREYSNITNDSIYNEHTYNLYENNNFVGSYSIEYDNKELYHDSNMNEYKPNGDIVGLFGNIDFEFKPIEEIAFSLNDRIIINNALKENNITSKIIGNYKKYQADVDNDQEMETIYSIDNASASSYGESKSYAFIFTYENEKINYIYKYEGDINNKSNMCSPKFRNLIDINKDNKNEIFISCAYNDNENKSCMEIYQFSTNKYKKILSCS